MPLETRANRTYLTLDPDTFNLKQKVGDNEYNYANTYNGYFKTVKWQDSNHPKYPPKYLFVFTDEEGNEEIIQSSEGSIFSSTLINVLLGHENPVGQWFRVGVYESSGGFFACWLKDTDGGSEIPTLEGKYSKEQLDLMAKRSFNGDYTALAKKLYEDELLPKIESQLDANTSNSDSRSDMTKRGLGESVESQNKGVTQNDIAKKFDAVPAGSTISGNIDPGSDITGDLNDVDDDLPF